MTEPPAPMTLLTRKWETATAALVVDLSTCVLTLRVFFRGFIGWLQMSDISIVSYETHQGRCLHHPVPALLCVVKKLHRLQNACQAAGLSDRTPGMNSTPILTLGLTLQGHGQ